MPTTCVPTAKNQRADLIDYAWPQALALALREELEVLRTKNWFSAAG
jgi:hypothetical protein